MYICTWLQAVARIFRYGQKRETFIYRLLWDKTMEHKIYRRNLDKEGLARQVVDSKNLRGEPLPCRRPLLIMQSAVQWQFKMGIAGL